ncbi:MAG: transposase [Acidobacteriota bacterium]|jgi:REP element-mobilizing transposase RayT|nr:transposase [Acidobacteriota bacterium]
MNLDYEYDYNDFPLAYLITVRTFGTWLHGDKRMSVDRHGKNLYGTPRVASSPKMEKQMLKNMNQPHFLLDNKQRECVEKSITEVCENRGYELKSVNIRTNHFHAVVSAACKPEPVIHAFKSYATRNLRENKLVETNKKLWARGKSRRYLWKPRYVSLAIEYVLYGQGDNLADFDAMIEKVEKGRNPSVNGGAV